MIELRQSEDDWCKAKLIKSRVVAIAHTKLEMKSFDISYVPSSFEEWNETDAVVELEVKSDRLRMILGPPVVEEAKIVESTGTHKLYDLFLISVVFFCMLCI